MEQNCVKMTCRPSFEATARRDQSCPCSLAATESNPKHSHGLFSHSGDRHTALITPEWETLYSGTAQLSHHTWSLINQLYTQWPLDPVHLHPVPQTSHPVTQTPKLCSALGLQYTRSLTFLWGHSGAGYSSAFLLVTHPDPHTAKSSTSYPIYLAPKQNLFNIREPCPCIKDGWNPSEDKVCSTLSMVVMNRVLHVSSSHGLSPQCTKASLSTQCALLWRYIQDTSQGP